MNSDVLARGEVELCVQHLSKLDRVPLGVDLGLPAELRACVLFRDYGLGLWFRQTLGAQQVNNRHTIGTR